MTGSTLWRSLGVGLGIVAVGVVGGTAEAEAQDPVSRVVPTLPTPGILPPGPSVSDWQPRSRAVTGGTIVVTGSGFQPGNVAVVIGSAKFPLPVRATSTTTRLELDVPDAALGKLGALVVSNPGTRGTTIEANYRIDPPNPALLGVTVAAPLVPDLVRQVTVTIREFPGPSVNIDAITFHGGTCFFKKRRNTVFGTARREADLSIRLTFQGWFERQGSCEFRLSMMALSATGAPVAPAEITVPVTVAAPTIYPMENTSSLLDRLAPKVSHSGPGNICRADNGPWPGGGLIGPTTQGGDLRFIVRGTLIGVTCDYLTESVLLPPGVKLERIEFSTTKNGERCGTGGTFGGPLFHLPMGRGVATVNPRHDGTPEEFTASGDDTITEDGVVYASGLNEPRTVLLPMRFSFECASMATMLRLDGRWEPPTMDPQSFAIRVDRVVFSGPPGLSVGQILQ